MYQTANPTLSAQVPDTSGLMEPFGLAWRLLGRVPLEVPIILARIGLAGVFFKSYQVKAVDPFTWSNPFPFLGEDGPFGWITVKGQQLNLFRDFYQVPVLPHEVAAYMATAAELILPILLVLGLATRFAAAALLAMTLVIQLFVLPGSWDAHALWAAGLVLILTRGAGVVALDTVIGRLFARP